MSPAGDADEADVGQVAELLANACAREILVRTAGEALSGDELADRCDASRTTVYRQLERLEAAGLVVGAVQLDPDGHHFERYRASLDRVTIDLDTDGVHMTIDRTEPATDAVDRLEGLFDRLR
ncbi:ArsR/SmtB family transcription factor [Haloglomus litoreum]|uniref:ArsR/SmtB family transcription factor n=1 Tax=Haloglomus litoreum TaxID=3034026 RepID=UPI0023E8A400|nr:helix-turn-helix domain-containing protein [Haloglomus sp. DT116]